MKNSEIKKLALCAMLTATAVILNLLSSVFPTMSLSILAISAFATAAALIECGYKYAILVYAAVAILSFFMVPDRSSTVFYVFLFGHYPVIKFAAERIRKPFISWAVKFACANTMFSVIYFLFSAYIGVYDRFTGDGAAGFYLIFNIAFVLYDVCMTRLMRIYMSNRHGRRQS